MIELAHSTSLGLSRQVSPLSPLSPLDEGLLDAHSKVTEQFNKRKFRQNMAKMLNLQKQRRKSMLPSIESPRYQHPQASTHTGDTFADVGKASLFKQKTTGGRQSQSLRCEFELDRLTSDPEDGSEANDSISRISSFLPNAYQTYAFDSKTNVMDCRATRLREIEVYHNKRLILPDDPWKLKWNIFLILFILVSSIITPLRASFYDQDSLAWVLMEMLIDIVFILDIVFTFFSAYYNDSEQLVSSRRAICCHYVRSWFILDLISVLPFSLIFKSSTNQLGKLAKMPRVFQLLKTIRFMRLLKVVKARKIIKKQAAKSLRVRSVQMEMLTLLCFVMGILCHTLACLWFLLAKLQDFNESTWVLRYNYEDVAVGQQYLASLYFIVTTITTVGYGDITSRNPAEQVFSIVLMVIGVVSYSMAISSFSSFMSVFNRKQKSLMAKLNILSHLREQFDLSFDLYWRLRQSLHYEHTMDMSEKINFVKELPSKLNIELSNIMYAQKLQGIKFFERQTPQFIASLAPKLKPLKVSKGDYIFLQGDAVDAIYFIKQGEAAYVERRPKADLIFAVNRAGSFFGDIDFAVDNEEDPTRLFTVKAKTDMDLLVLEKHDLYGLDQGFQKEMFALFKDSYRHLDKLNAMKKRSTLWLKRRYMDPPTTASSQQQQEQPGCQRLLDERTSSFKLAKSRPESRLEPKLFETSETFLRNSCFSPLDGGRLSLKQELKSRQQSFVLKKNKKKQRGPAHYPAVRRTQYQIQVQSGGEEDSEDYSPERHSLPPQISSPRQPLQRERQGAGQGGAGSGGGREGGSVPPRLRFCSPKAKSRFLVEAGSEEEGGDGELEAEDNNDLTEQLMLEEVE